MFVRTKTEKMKNQQKEYEAQMQYRQHLQVWKRGGIGRRSLWDGRSVEEVCEVGGVLRGV